MIKWTKNATGAQESLLGEILKMRLYRKGVAGFYLTMEIDDGDCFYAVLHPTEAAAKQAAEHKAYGVLRATLVNLAEEQRKIAQKQLSLMALLDDFFTPPPSPES